MDLCQHCNYSPAQFLAVWRYPDERYSLAAAMCAPCAEQVRLRHQRGHLIITEWSVWDEWLGEGREQDSVPTGSLL